MKEKEKKNYILHGTVFNSFPNVPISFLTHEAQLVIIHTNSVDITPALHFYHARVTIRRYDPCVFL